MGQRLWHVSAFWTLHTTASMEGHCRLNACFWKACGDKWSELYGKLGSAVATNKTAETQHGFAVSGKD